DIVKQLERLFHEGEPKWGFVPDREKYIAEVFYQFTQSGNGSDLDRFVSQDARYGTIITLFRGYSHDLIMHAIETGKRWAAAHADAGVHYLFAGGLLGVLAAVNEAVESSYWLNLALIMGVVAACLYLTYGSLVATLVLMIPVVLSQLACEAFMYLWHIDLNVNSLPIAAAGAGVGVDYGIYHFSRMIDAFDEGRDIDAAVDYATATTGKAIIFTASTMVAGTIFWWFSALKFQAEMGLLLALLMVFNTFGGLVIVPAWVKILRPRFLSGRRAPRTRRRAAGGRVIVAEQLTKRFGAEVAVAGVSFHLARGEVVGLLGPNGAGKSTTLRLLAGVFPPTAGRALVDGQDVTRAPRAARRRLGYAPERPALHAEMTVEAALAFAAALREVAPRAARRAAVDTALARTGLL